MVLPRLFLAVETGDIDFQPGLLEILRQLIQSQADNTVTKGKNQPPSMFSPQTGADDGFLLQIILAAVTSPRMRPVLADWLEFVLSIAAAMDDTVTPLFYSITDTICNQIVIRASATEEGAGRSDIPILLQCSEGLVRLFADRPVANKAHQAVESVGLFGYVSTVLGGETITEGATSTVSLTAMIDQT